MTTPPWAIVDEDRLAALRADAESRLREAGGTPADLEQVRPYGKHVSTIVPGVPYAVWPDAVRGQRDALRARGGDALVGAFHRLVVLDRIAASRARLAAAPSLSALVEWFEFTVTGFLRDLAAMRDDRVDFTNDRFAKDLSVVALRLWPLGAEVVEPRMGLSRRMLLSGGASTALASLALLLRTGGRAPMYELHTYTRTLSQFTRDGWLACYRRIAGLLERDPGVRGVYGSAWFFDPQIATITPSIAYLRQDPEEGGATFVRVANSKQTVTLATAMSPARRELYDRGEYEPRQYLMVWPRRALIRWARR